MRLTPFRAWNTATFSFIALGFLQSCAPDDFTQSEACGRYVACVSALDEAAGLVTDTARFAPEGSCWGFSQAGFDLCDRACTAGLAFIQERYDEVPGECAP